MFVDSVPHFSVPPRLRAKWTTAQVPLLIALARVTAILEVHHPILREPIDVLRSLPRVAVALPVSDLTQEEVLSQILVPPINDALRLSRPNLERMQHMPSYARVLHEVLRLGVLYWLMLCFSELTGNKGVMKQYSGRMPVILRNASIDWAGLEDLELWLLVLGGLVEKETLWSVFGWQNGLRTGCRSKARLGTMCETRSKTSSGLTAYWDPCSPY